MAGVGATDVVVPSGSGCPVVTVLVFVVAVVATVLLVVFLAVE